MRILLASLFLCAVFVFPVQAQQMVKPCECWCTGETGAASVGQKEPDSCIDACDALKQNVAGCVYEDDISGPQYNLRCFDQSRPEQVKLCGDLNGLMDTKQARECIQGSRYCLLDPSKNPTKLNIKIGGLYQVNGLGDYISTIYNYLLGISVLVVTIMFVIGGFQYVLSAGFSSQLAKAKERMKNATIGFVLLLSAYLILLTVNPALLKLQAPTVPLQKPAYVAGDDCDALLGQGFKIENGSRTCGNVLKVLEDKNGNAVAAGTTCMGLVCPETGNRQLCIRTPGGDKPAQCLSCSQITIDNVFRLQPSPSFCGAFNDKFGGPQPENRNAWYGCFYSTDEDALPTIRDAGDIAQKIAGIGGGTCGVVGATNGVGKGIIDRMNCSNITKCEDYEDVEFWNKSDSDTLDDVSDVLPLICAGDPCGAANKEGKGSCVSSSEDETCLGR